MFRIEKTWQYAHNDNLKTCKIKKMQQHHRESRKKLSKSKKYAKSPKNSKLKCINAASDYVGLERLTKHVGFFTKGKISDSISRVEKLMPKEVRARAKQDLKQVLKLTNTSKNKRERKRQRSHASTFKKQSVQNLIVTPQYLSYKTGFASCSWKDKLSKSVGLSTVNNSVLASVHEPSKKALPVEEELQIARKVLITKIHPCIKKVNCSLFPNVSNKDKLKRKFLEIKNQFVPSDSSGKTSVSSDICENVQTSVKSDKELSQSTVEEDFQLNPIFTGDDIDHNDISRIFPSVNEFLNCNGDITGIPSGVSNGLYNDCNGDITGIPLSVSNGLYDDCNGDITGISPGVSNGLYDDEINSSQPASSFRRGSNSLNFVPSSPTSSNDSPALKLQVSPIKFKPDLIPTPTIYFRHKMF